MILLIGCSVVVDSDDSQGTNYCEPNPCLNGNECIGNSETYLCDCTDDWDGDNCEISNSLLVGNWEFYSGSAFTNTDCVGIPFGFYYTDSPEWLALFGNATNYQLNVIYDSDLTFDQTQILEAADGEITIDQNYGTITDNGIGRKKTMEVASEKVNTQKKSIGINLTLRRLQNFSKNLRNTYALRFIDLYDEQEYPAGTQVLIDLPIK